MSDQQMKRKLVELGLELFAIQLMLEQGKSELENLSSIEDGMKLEKHMEQISRQLVATGRRVEKAYHAAMAKAKARGLLLH
jgi:hypothetical protein